MSRGSSFQHKSSEQNIEVSYFDALELLGPVEYTVHAALSVSVGAEATIDATPGGMIKVKKSGSKTDAKQ